MSSPTPKTKVYIVVPGKNITGGPELAHQLADVLNRDEERCWVVYCPFNKKFDIPFPYQKYNVRPAMIEDIEPGSIVILPEPAVHMFTLFPQSKIYFWWMSVDGFVKAATRWDRELKDDLVTVEETVERHLYQSEYSRAYLWSHKLEPVDHLSDRLAQEYLDAIAEEPQRSRRNLVVYNPVKGMHRNRRVLHELSKRPNVPEVVPIRGLQPYQVRELLLQAKVYIDFGDHPGKDRLPREAAACGACVLVNRRGSAGNIIDMPIPEGFRIDDTIPGFEAGAVDTICKMLEDFELYAPLFNDYRRKIAAESAQFEADVAAVFGA
jgi:hypothetical protein